MTFTAFGSTAARADTSPVTYTATQTIPVPPASNYAGTGGGDGWAVAMTPTAVFNVFHHNASFVVACHLQADAKPCWSGDLGETRTITQPVGDGTSGFATSGQPGLWIDQTTGRLYAYATRTSDSTGGVVCVDTVSAPTQQDPFCGFTALTAVGESPVAGNSYLSNGALVGNRWFAFNYVPSSGAVGTKNRLLCFDVSTLGPCAGQPFTVGLGAAAGAAGTVTAGSFPSPAVVAISNEVIVPITVDGTPKLACFDGASLGSCGGAWPVTLDFGYPSGAGSAFPRLSADGTVTGLCLPANNAPCFDLTGASVSTPQGLWSALGSQTSTPWNGPAFVLGPRVYVPNGNTNQVHCFDYNLGTGCANFPKSFQNLGYLYTVNSDPQRPTCIWVNADNGSQQIQNFDAFTGGACGEGPIRVLASSSVVATPLCTPGSWTSLQVTEPSRSSYKSGSIGFQDSSGTPIPGAADVQLDANGSADLRGLDLARGVGLPQFLITLDGTQGTPGSVSVKLTWTGAYDPSCETKPGTTVVNPPSGTPTKAPPPKADVRLSVTAPTELRTSDSITFVTTVTNYGPDTATGIIVRTPVPAGAKLVSVTASTGNGCVGGDVATCYIGTLASGQSATMTTVFSSPDAMTLNVTSTAESDYDPDHGSNSAGASTVVLAPGAVPPAPPASSAPGTFNAVGTGTILVNGVPHPADQQFVLNSGDIVDVSDGIITFTDSDGKYGSWAGTRFVTQRRTSGVSSSQLSTAGLPDGVTAKFQVQQPATAGSPTTLTLVGGDFTGCESQRSVAAKSKRPVQQLWGSAKGNFTTKGRFSAATVRGTVWMVQDRCDGTLTEVVEGVVEVEDTTAQKTVSVGPGQTYLALAPQERAAFRPPLLTPRQTPAQVKKRGLVWGTKRYGTRKSFERYLKANDYTWQQFAGAYPRLAAALAKRKR